MRRLLVAAVVLLVPLNAKAAVQQFDLVCKGKTVDVSQDKPDNLRLSIDLRRMLFCYRQDGCKTAIDIRSVSAATVVLRSEHNTKVDFDYVINRSDSSYSSVYRPKGADWEINSAGKCDVAPFSGVPAGKF